MKTCGKILRLVLSPVTVTLSCHVPHVLPSLSEVHVFDMARYYRGIVVLLFYNI